jgi:hypothetical protein
VTQSTKPGKIWRELFGDVSPDEIENEALRKDAVSFVEECQEFRERDGARCIATNPGYFDHAGSALLFALWNPGDREVRVLVERGSGSGFGFLEQYAAEGDDFLEGNYAAVMKAVASLRRNSDFKLLRANGETARTLFGHRILFSGNPGLTWGTDLRVVTFNRHWVIVLYWNDWEENPEDVIPYFIGFAARAKLHASVALLLDKNMGELVEYNHPDSEFDSYGPMKSTKKIKKLCCRATEEF